MAVSYISPLFSAADALGAPLVSGKLYTYLAGTTTPATTYSDAAGSSANANPIILNARGEAVLFLTAGTNYKFVLKTAADVTIWTQDDIVGPLSSATLAGSSGSSNVGWIQSGAGTAARTVQAKLRDVLSVKDFGVTGDGVTNDTANFQAAIAEALASPQRALYVPAGSYYVPQGLVVDGTSVDRFTIHGDGRSSDIWSDQTGVNTLDLKGVANTFQHCLVKEVAVRNTHAAGNAIRTRNTEFLRINKCTISGGNVGLIMSETGGESDIKPQIHECIFSGGTYGIQGGDTRVADASVKDNIFIDCTTTMMQFGFLDGGTVTGNKLFSNNGSGNAVKGILLKKPIYVFCEDNDLFELGGNGMSITTPRHSRFNNNTFVNVGQNASGEAMIVQDFDASLVGQDVTISGNTFKDCNGSGLYVTSTNTLQKKYIIKDNTFLNVGDGAGTSSAIHLVKCTDFLVADNFVDGNSVTDNWLNLDASTGIKLRNNVHVSVTNADVQRVNNPTMIIEKGNRYVTGVTSTTTLLFDDDGAISGTLTANTTVNLPSAVSCPQKIYTFVKADSAAFNLVIDPASTQTIDGAATLSVTTQYQAVSIISDGANWITLYS